MWQVRESLVMTPDIKKFLNNPRTRNSWLESKLLRVYVRKGFHSIDGQIRTTFDVANVEVPWKLQGRGIFTRWLQSVEVYVTTYTTLDCVFVESILETNLIPFLTRKGYIPVKGSNPPSMYKNSVRNRNPYPCV
jgi:hypothetical protein